MRANDRTHFGKLIQLRVKELGLSNTEAAKLLNIHRTTLLYWYKQPSHDVYLLQDVGVQLSYDFLQHLNQPHSDVLLHNEHKVITVSLTTEEHQNLFDKGKVLRLEMRVQKK